MNVYLDERGDLDWKFDKPYRKGGSSRYLTIAFLLVPKDLSHLPKRIVKSLYNQRKQPSSQELKASDLKSPEIVYFSEQGRNKRNYNLRIKELRDSGIIEFLNSQFLNH